MDSIHNYDEIYKLGIPVPQSKAVENMDIIEYAFGYNPMTRVLNRYSNQDMDLIFVNWLCSEIINKYNYIDGYGYLNLPGLITEVFICDIGKLLVKTDIEYRLVGTNTDLLLQTKGGKLTGETVKFSDLVLLSGGKRIKLIPDYRGIYIPQYPSDKFLEEEPFKSRINEEIKRQKEWLKELDT